MKDARDAAVHHQNLAKVLTAAVTGVTTDDTPGPQLVEALVAAAYLRSHSVSTVSNWVTVKESESAFPEKLVARVLRLAQGSLDTPAAKRPETGK